MSRSIIPPSLAVKAMRDNGYKNAAYALAELMDNSIQAGASLVELMCYEETEYHGGRSRIKISEIGILDNGSGMSKNVLEMALQFGNGTRLDEKHQTGIGKFGMGLPASSISQSRKVEVWSWDKNTDSALYTYLDLDEIIKEKMTEVPEPKHKKIPDKWVTISNGISKSGTLVVWSKIDKCLWKTGKTIITHSENLIGRIYRKFINDGRCKIRMITFNDDGIVLEKDAKPNDPMYLTENTSTPEPYNILPMFQKWGEDVIIPVEYADKVHNVIIRFSYAKEEARPGDSAGSKPYGQHASKNTGVSIVRADREIELSTAWCIHHDVRERWWGVEVEFPPALDEIFGLTNNNKQFEISSIWPIMITIRLMAQSCNSKNN
jgi:hypothetical protein